MKDQTLIQTEAPPPFVIRDRADYLSTDAEILLSGDRFRSDGGVLWYYMPVTKGRGASRTMYSSTSLSIYSVSLDAAGSLEAEEAVTPEWRGTQAVRGRSAKPFIAGSIPARASTLYISLK
jgi:hypothetical protein